ncbi:MAG TPA: Gfo/Idh/MocA family oxidoreductase [Caldilineaceae bacterium]|nr:Gfo/Idh/MocA family oxidoreductase [Caldilineaceae bacterium]
MGLNPPIDIALIGTGNRSQTTYAPLFDFLRPWVRLVAVCDPVKENADRYADRMDVPAFYSLADLVKARPMEAALVVAPVDIHHAIACYLMSHGIHCHVETSMSSLLVQAREMVETARKHQVILRIAENFIRFPFDRIAKKIDESGFLGPVHRLLNLHDHTGYHNNSRWIHFMGAYPEAVQAIRHTMPTAPHYESAHRFHTSETYRAHFFTFPGNRLVIDQAANIKGLLGRYPRPGYTEIDGERGTIVRTASDQSNPQRGWTSEAEVRYVSDEALNTKAIADQVFPIRHHSENGCWASEYVDLPIGRVEYVNPYRLPPEANEAHAHRDYYGVAIVDHVIDFAEAVRGVAPSEYTDEDAYMAMMMEVATRESALRDGQRLCLPLQGELASEEKVRAELRAKHGVDPLDIEAMIAVSVPRP